jgi:hypothetical protein
MKAEPKAVELDAMLTLEECAAWLRISPRTMRDLVRTTPGLVHAPNPRLWRFHPRTVLARFNRQTCFGGSHDVPC